MLTFNLKKQRYEKIRNGEKTIEYREVKDYWTIRLANAYMVSTDNSEVLHNEMFNYLMEEKINDVYDSFAEVAREKGILVQFYCKLRLGYTKQYMTATITKIKIVNGKNTDLAIDKPVYAIYLDNVKEMEK